MLERSFPKLEVMAEKCSSTGCGDGYDGQGAGDAMDKLEDWNTR